jgi:hypothetical protein
MSQILSPIEPDITFFMLEGSIGDATSMVDATNTLIESQFGVVAKDGAYFVDEEIAAQIFFLSGDDPQGPAGILCGFGQRPAR